MGHSYKARERQPIKDIDGLRKFLVEEAEKRYGQIDNAIVFMYCGPMKYAKFQETVPQYMLIIETEGEEKFEFVPTSVIDPLLNEPKDKETNI